MSRQNSKKISHIIYIKAILMYNFLKLYCLFLLFFFVVFYYKFQKRKKYNIFITFDYLKL